MARSVLAMLRELIEGNSAVRKVADDPSLMAELLLLFRMILADGEVSAEEMTMLRRIASEAFGIEGADLDLVLEHLADFGYETSSGQALAIFREFDRDRRVTLARHMAEIAKADRDLSKVEVRLLARVVDMLELEPADVVPGAELR